MAVARTQRAVPASPGARVVRALAAHPHRTAAGLLALFVLAYLWPALVGGRILAPTALLFSDPPWSAGAPAGIAHWMNGDLADVPISYYAWDVLARHLIHAGTFPAWNPYAFAGTPLLANFEVAWLSPFSLPLWLLPLGYGLGVAAALKLWTAGFGTYLLVRELRLGFWPAMLAAVSFALCAFNVVWLSHGVFVSVAALLPWMLWLTERIVRRGRPLEGLALAVVAACAVAGGHPGTQVHAFAATALYALARVAATPGTAGRERLARLGLVGGALALGTLTMAVLLLPANQAAAGTVGMTARRHGSPSYLSSRIPWHALRTALFPDWWGRPSEHVLAGPSTYRERTFYAGAVALLLAGVGIVSPGAWRRKAPFAGLAVLGAAIAVRTPGLWDLVIRLPLFDQVQNGRILLWFTFAVPILAAFGLQALLDDPRLVRRAAVVLGAGALAGLVAIASLKLGGRTVGDAISYMAKRTEAERPAAVISLASAGWWLAWVLAVAAVLLLWRRYARRAGWLLGGLVVLLAALDMLHFAHANQPMGPASKVVPPRTPAIAFLQRHAGDGRIAGVVRQVDVNNWMLQADFSTVYGLRDVRGYDAPQPSERYFRLWRTMGADIATPYADPTLSATSARVLGLLGARWIVAGPERARAPPDVRLVYRGRDARVYRNRDAAPRATVAAHVAVVPGEVAEVAAVASPRFDARSDAVLPREAVRGGAVPGGAGTVRVAHEENASVTLRATLSRPGLVVLDDAWAPGWRVTIDGSAARALRTDVLLRGVVVPRGTHTIVWRYEVPGLRTGAVLSGLGLALLLGWGGTLWWIARRRRAR